MAQTPNKDQRRLHRQLDRLARLLPRWMGRALAWLQRPSSRWVRIPAGLLLIAGGIFSFLPLLGLWMLPLGLLLLALDLPFLRRPTSRVLMSAERRVTKWRRGRKR
jgi:hypothetical protein